MPSPWPEPAELQLVKGAPGNRPVKIPPKSERGIGKCPGKQTAAVKRIWRRSTKEWSLLLCEQDRAALLIYCQLEAMAEQAWEQVCRVGPVLENSKGEFVESPWARRLRHLNADRSRLLTYFGATPTSRMRVPTGKMVTSAMAKRAGSGLLT